MFAKLVCIAVLLFVELLAQAAPPPKQLSPEDRTAQAVARVVFASISRFYKMRMMGDLVATKERPVTIVFSEADSGGLNTSTTESGLTVEVRADLQARGVELSMQDQSKAANEARKKNPDVYVQIESPKLVVKSRHFDCAGTFTGDGKAVKFTNAEARLTGAEAPVRFADGARMQIDGKHYTFKQGKWSP